jgi:hypothetical protein
MTQRIENTVFEATPNASIPASDFAFAPPAGSTERKSMPDLLKAGK